MNGQGTEIEATCDCAAGDLGHQLTSQDSTATMGSSRRAAASRLAAGFMPHPSAGSFAAMRRSDSKLSGEMGSNLTLGRASTQSSPSSPLSVRSSCCSLTAGGSRDDASFHMDRSTDWWMESPVMSRRVPGELATFMKRGFSLLEGQSGRSIVAPSMGICPFDLFDDRSPAIPYMEDSEDDLFLTAGLDAPFDGASALKKLKGSNNFAGAQDSNHSPPTRRSKPEPQV